MVPIVAGLLMGAAMGGGIAALQKKDILQGALMGGVGGALGGAFMPAAAGVAPGVTDGVTGAISSGGVGGVAATPGFSGAASGAGGIFGASGGIGSFLGANKYALAGGALGGMMAPGEQPKPADTGNIYTTEFTQTRNPQFGIDPNASYFTQGYGEGSYSKASDYNPTMTAANGGIIALAEGGKALELEPYRPVETNRYSTPVRTMTPEVAAYNQQLMARANQQYNVNPRPLPIQVPGSPGYVAPTYNAPTSPAPSAAALSANEFIYDPVTRRYTGGISNLDQKSEIDKLREEMNMLRGGSSYGYGDSGGDVGANDMGNDPGAPAGSSPSDAGNQGNQAGEMGEANGGRIKQRYNMGGLSSLGDYSDGGRLLKGPGDGVSDDIPARIGARQPARLADGEFVVPARIVSEIGNGSTDAGAKRLYAMMDRVQKGRKKSVGKGKVAVDSKAHKMLPA